MVPSVNILGYQRRVHLIPYLCGMGCKRALVFEMEDMISVCLIIIITNRIYIALNELQRDVNQFSQSINGNIWIVVLVVQWVRL